MDAQVLRKVRAQDTQRRQPLPVDLAPRPATVAETGLSESLLCGLVAKHLHDGGVTDISGLVTRTALAGPVLEALLALLRKDACVEVHGPKQNSGALRYGLTERGRTFALDERAKCGYLGPAPVPVERYAQVVLAQSVHKQQVTRGLMRQAFANVTIRDSLLDQLGPALHSGRAIVIYGAAGTGKTYIGRHLATVISGNILVPHAIAVGDTIIQVFDRLIHQPVGDLDRPSGLMLQEGHDPRFVLCTRPAVLTGGELTLDMLEVGYEPATRQHQAPLQLKANNGVYLLDDLGRQRVAPVDLFNRWIVPMETRQDYLGLASGKRFPVPFDVVLIFSTNLNPMDLADEAFIRRLGHKIEFGALSPEEYGAIWQQVCRQHGVPFDPRLLDYVVEGLHARHGVPLLACHPRDLLGMAVDEAKYRNTPNQLNKELLENAWRSYFVTRRSGASEPGVGVTP